MTDTDKEKLDAIYKAIVGDEFHPNGISKRLWKVEKRTRRHDFYFGFLFALVGALTTLSILAYNIKNILK